MTTTLTSRPVQTRTSQSPSVLPRRVQSCITDRGRPAHVLMTIEEYHRLTAAEGSIVDRLAMGRRRCGTVRSTQSALWVCAPPICPDRAFRPPVRPVRTSFDGSSCSIPTLCPNCAVPGLAGRNRVSSRGRMHNRPARLFLSAIHRCSRSNSAAASGRTVETHESGAGGLRAWLEGQVLPCLRGPGAARRRGRGAAGGHPSCPRSRSRT